MNWKQTNETNKTKQKIRNISPEYHIFDILIKMARGNKKVSWGVKGRVFSFSNQIEKFLLEKVYLVYRLNN